MNLQYISDSMGKTTGVFIPISEWNKLKKQYHNIDQETIDIPERQKSLVRSRLNEYAKKPEQAFDFDTTLNEIENDL